MTPDERQMLNELYIWMKERKVQQLALPVDDASRAALGAVTGKGPGSTTKTQSVAVSSTPTNITVPAAYVQTVVVEIDGTQYEIPSLV